MPENIFQLKTQNGYDFYEVVSALQKEIRRGNEREALYWAYELIPYYENYLWKRLKVIVNEDIGIANPTLITIVQTLSAQYFEFREKKDTSCTMCITNAILLMCRSKKTRIADHLTIAMEQTKAHQMDKPAISSKRPIPDYALDMHTKRGRAMGRGLEHFREEGALLHNPDESIEDLYEEEAYESLKHAKKWPEKWPKVNGKKEENRNGTLKFEE